MYNDLIEIENSDNGHSKLTVSSYHAVDLLTYLQEKGIKALGQNAPTFGFDDFPTIYYVNFSIPANDLGSEVKNYFTKISLSYSEVKAEDGSLKFSDFMKGMQS